MEFKLQEMTLEELDKLVELAYREKTRRKKVIVDNYFKEFKDLLNKMQDDGIYVSVECDYGYERICADDCFLDSDEIRINV